MHKNATSKRLQKWEEKGKKGDGSVLQVQEFAESFPGF
jgi:hypothetical protein